MKLVLVSELESDGLAVSLGSRQEIGRGSEVSLGVEMGVADGSRGPNVGQRLPPAFLFPFPNLCPFPSPTVKEVLAVPNSILELPCPHLSALASYHWSHGRAAVPEASSTVYNGSLLLLLRDGVGGLYQCWATENDFSYPVVSYWVDSQDQSLALDPELAGIPRERVEAPLTRVGGGAALAAQRSYWPHFLTVTVLLALVLSGALIILLTSPLGALRARGKVQGCGTLPSREKAPLSRERHLQPSKECRTSTSDVDADNNHLGTEVA